MKKVFCLLALLGVTAAQPVFGDYWAAETTSGGFSGAGTDPKGSHPFWMNGLPDSMRISELSIPGTHDSGTESYYNNDFFSQFAICQDATVYSQLLSGVRFLDLRVIGLKLDTNWRLVHQNYLFRDLLVVLDEVDQFLRVFPSETVMVRISATGSETMFTNYYNTTILTRYPNIWQRAGRIRADGVTPTTYADHVGDGSYYWPTLGEVRGKMVMFVAPNPLLLQKKGHTSGLLYVPHYPLSELKGSRQYDGKVVGFTRDQYDQSFWPTKFLDDDRFIEAASADRRETVLYATGINISYNPLLFPTTGPLGYAEEMNRLLLNKLNSQTNSLRKTGLVLMDFPGPGLLSSIIALNFRHNTSASSVYPSFSTYAYQLPFENNLNFEYQPTWQARGWRRLVKERIPSTEFNTFVAKGVVTYFNHTISASDPNTLSVAVGPLTGGWDTYTIGVLFQSHKLPPAYTSGQIQGALDQQIAAGSSTEQIKSFFAANYGLHDWTVFTYVTYGLPNEGLPDFDTNVVWAANLFWNGVNYAKTIVAGSRKPDVVSTQESTRSVVGHWEFPHPQWTNALVGSNLPAIGGSVIPSAGEYIFLSRPTPGIKMSTGSAPNGGPSAIRLHQWTLVMDLVPFETGLTSLIQIDSLDNSTDGEVFIKSPGGIGVKGQLFGTVPQTGLHRVVVAVDATQEQLMSLYIDGTKVGEIPTRTFKATGDVVNGYTYSEQDRWSLRDQSILFGDNNGESGGLIVSGIQLRNYKMSDAEVARLGGVSTSRDRIPNDDKKVFIDLAGRPELQVVDEAGLQRMVDVPDQIKLTWKPTDVLQSSDDLSAPFSDVPDVRNSGTYYPASDSAPNAAQKFFRLRLP